MSNLTMRDMTGVLKKLNEVHYDLIIKLHPDGSGCFVQGHDEDICVADWDNLEEMENTIMDLLDLHVQTKSSIIKSYLKATK